MQDEQKLLDWKSQAQRAMQRHRGEGYAERLEACADHGLKILAEKEAALDTIANLIDEEGGDE